MVVKQRLTWRKHSLFYYARQVNLWRRCPRFYRIEQVSGLFGFGSSPYSGVLEDSKALGTIGIQGINGLLF